jgi:hypothetical protein
MMALLEDIVTREARRQRNLSMNHEDNEKDHALLIQRALGFALPLSYERVAREPLSSEIAFLLMRLALEKLLREGTPARESVTEGGRSLISPLPLSASPLALRHSPR